MKIKPHRVPHRYLWQRLWAAIRIATATFVLLIGVLAGIKEIVQHQSSRHEIAGTLMVVAMISIALGMWKARVVHIPDLPFVDSTNKQTLRCKICSPQELNEANALATSPYGRDAISDDVVEQWRLTNPCVFACVLNAKGEVESSFGVMPLTDSFLDQFIAGKVVESQITSEDILPTSSFRNTSRLYISGVVVRDPKSTRGQMRTGAMVWAMVVYLKRIYGLRRQRTLYALAATKEGTRMLKHLHFSLISSASQRADGHDLYSLILNRESAGNIEHSMPDYHQMCCTEFAVDVPKSLKRVQPKGKKAS